jgi:hypothetical protein
MVRVTVSEALAERKQKTPLSGAFVCLISRGAEI